jgi:hypothetical protein
VLRERLADARGAGVGFADAWAAGLRAALDVAGSERSEWRQVLSETAEAWRVGFDRCSAAGRRERALLVLASDPERTVPVAPLCENCGGPIPPERNRGARFCGGQCRRQHNY